MYAYAIFSIESRLKWFQTSLICFFFILYKDYQGFKLIVFQSHCLATYQLIIKYTPEIKLQLANKEGEEEKKRKVHFLQYNIHSHFISQGNRFANPKHSCINKTLQLATCTWPSNTDYQMGDFTASWQAKSFSAWLEPRVLMIATCLKQKKKGNEFKIILT